MTQNAELMLTLAYDHQRELVAEADRERVLSSTRRSRKSARADRTRSTTPHQ